MEWELLATPGKRPETFTLDGAAAKQLLADAVSAAEDTGLVWQKERITLKPDDGGPFVAQVFKTISEPHVGDVTFFRIVSSSMLRTPVFTISGPVRHAVT